MLNIELGSQAVKPEPTPGRRRSTTPVETVSEYFLSYPGYAELLERYGFSDFDRVMGWSRGALIGVHRARDVLRVELCHEGQPVTFFLKREFRPQWRDRILNFFRGTGAATKSRHEWQILHLLRAHGLGCPEPVCVAERGSWRRQAFLVVRALGGAQGLTEYLRTRRPSGRDRHRLAARLGQEIARFHSAGFDHPDLFSKHVFLQGEPGDELTVYLLDMARTRQRKRLAPRHRWRDLAALNATLPEGLNSRTDRLVFLKAYLEASGLEIPLHVASEALARRTKRLLPRRKVREMRRGQAPEIPRRRPVRVAGEPMWADADYLPWLRRCGLAAFNAVMEDTTGRVVRRLKDRENVILELPHPHHGTARAYLKRHHSSDPLGWMWAKLRRGSFVSPGRREASNIPRLERAGVRTMRLIAAGERFRQPWSVDSFVLTEEVPGAVQLDHFLRRRFTDLKEKSQRTELRQLVAAVAEVTRRFHEAGYNHRDLYCCHFLIREPKPARFAVHMIDLQRVQHRRRWRTRWLVKDLSQLNYSAPREIVSRTDRLRFFLRWRGVDRLARADKRLVRRILSKTARIARRGIAP